MKKISQISKILSITLFFLFSGITVAGQNFGHTLPADKDIILSFGFATQPNLPNRMNILVWNLHKGLNETFASDYLTLAADRDLVLSQEMYLTPYMRSVFGIFSDYYYITATSFFMGKILARTGVDTSSPVLPSEIRYVKTGTLEPVVNSPKMTLITRYPMANTNKLLTIANIHGINFVDSFSYRKEINKIYEALKDIPSPIIFAGDFNSWSDERESILKEMCSKLKLKETAFNPDFRMKFNDHVLDHFYFTDDIKVISAKVEESYLGSDHKPLEVVIEYVPQALSKNH